VRLKTQYEEFGTNAESPALASGRLFINDSDKATEGEAMLRKGIVALMISVMSISGLQAADGKSSNSLLGLFRGPSIGRTQQQATKSNPAPGGVQHAIVADVDRQVPEIRQTGAAPALPELQPAESAPQPTPVQYARSAPLVTPETHPQYFDASDGQSGVPESNSGPFHFASSRTTDFGSHPGGGGFSHHPHHLPNGAYLPGNASADGGGASLYPGPRPGIPHEIGGTAIVHQAFHPHEMLYAHRYKSMYGPYYYKVNGHWMVTPFGVWSKENWKLQGTTVDVKYKSHISPFAMFHRPVIR
jgi:hypothetical protein